MTVVMVRKTQRPMARLPPSIHSTERQPSPTTVVLLLYKPTHSATRHRVCCPQIANNAEQTSDRTAISAYALHLLSTP